MQSMSSATEPSPFPVCGPNSSLCEIPESISLAMGESSVLLLCIRSFIQLCGDADNFQPDRSVKEL